MKKKILFRVLMMFLIITLSLALYPQDIEKQPQKSRREIVKRKETKVETKIDSGKTQKQFYQRSNPPRKNTPPIRIYPEKSSGDLVEFSWKQFENKNYEHAVECFQELIARKDSLTDAYLGLDWSKLMLYQPIEETRIIKSSDFVKNREFYILKPTEFLDLYSEEDDCPKGWINNAIKLNENGNPLHILPKENMPVYDWDMFPVVLYIDSGTVLSDQRTMKSIELNSESGIVYNFRPIWIIPENEDYCIYNPKFGFIEIFDELFSQLSGDFYKYVIGTSYLRTIDNTLYWSDGIELSDKAGNTPNLLFTLSRSDSTNVKIIKRKNPDLNSDTWDYQVFNHYDFSGDSKRPGSNKYIINEEAFSIDIYKIDADGKRNHIVPGSEMTYIDYLRLDTNEDGEINNLDSTINLEENWIRFPFIRPFESLGENEIYDSNLTDKLETNITIELKLRYVDYDAFLSISRIFADASKYIDPKKNGLYLSGASFRWLIKNRYKTSIECSSKLIDQNWSHRNDYNINYKDLLVVRAYSYFQINEYENCLSDIQKLNSGVTINIDEIEMLKDKIEEMMLSVEIKIK